jgi:hypothetical protein
MTPATATPPTTNAPELAAEQSQTPATTSTTRTTTARAPSQRLELPSLAPFGEALDALVGLEPDWDSYGALPPSPLALQYAWIFVSMLVENGLSIPQVFPTRSGGIQLEWHLPHASLEWEADSHAASGSFAFDDRVTGERLDGELPGDLDGLAAALNRLLAGEHAAG